MNYIYKIIIIIVSGLLIFAGISFIDHGSSQGAGSVCIIMACGLIALLVMKDKK